jgi:ABC-type Na+ efflux pump permease subunit
MVLAPLQTASAIIEETDERTMEMLVLTKLRPGQILSAKVLSRILVLVTIVSGCRQTAHRA